MASVHNIILRISGDADEARRELARTATELAALDKMEAEAKVEAQTKTAERQLTQLRAKLEKLSAMTATPEVDAKTAEARAKIDLLEAKLRALAARSYEVDVDTDASTAGLNRFAAASSRAGTSTASFAGVTKIVTSRLALMAGAITALLPILAGLVSSLGAAAVGLGALGVAGVMALLPLIPLVGVVIARFKAMKNEGGTAANALSREFEQFEQVLGNQLGPAADRVMRGLASGLQAIHPTIRALSDEFTLLGTKVGQAFQYIGAAISSPAIQSGLSQLIKGTSQLVGPITRGLMSMFQVLLNIANAAMPMLVQGARSLAQTMAQWARGTNNVRQLRAQIQPLLGHLRAWWNLGKAIGDVFLAFFQVSGGKMRQFVNDAARGARELAAWIRSKAGRDSIRQFLDQALPLIKSFAKTAGLVAKVFLEWGPVILPVLRVMTDLLRPLLRLLADLGKAAQKLPSPLKEVAGALLLLAVAKGPIGLLKSALGFILSGSLLRALGGLAGAARTAASGIVTAFSGIATKIGPALAKIGPVVTKVLGRVLGPIGTGLVVAESAKAMAETFTTRFEEHVANGMSDSEAVIAGSLDSTAGGSMSTAATGLGETFLNAFGIELEGGSDEVASSAASMTDDAARAAGIRGRAGMTRAGQQASKGFGQGLRAGRGEAQRGGRALSEGVAKGIISGRDRAQAGGRQVGQGSVRGTQQTRGQHQASGRGLGAALINGVKGMRGAATAGGKQVGGASNQGADSTRGAHTSTGRGLGAALSAGIGSQRGQAQGSGRQLGDAGQGGAKQAEPGFVDVGLALAAGLANGIANGASQVISAAVSIASDAFNAAKRALGIGSPSKVFMGIGRDSMEGFARGIEGMKGRIKQAIEAIVKTAKRVGTAVLDNPSLLGDIDNPRRQRQLSRLALASYEDMQRKLARSTGSLVSRDMMVNLDPRLQHSLIKGRQAPAAPAHHHYHPSTPGTGQPDPLVFLAEIERKLRLRGGLARA